MKNIVIIILAFAILTACKKENSDYYEGFEAISENSVFDSLHLLKDYSYYEIRDNFCFDSTSYNIIFSKGDKPYSDSLFSISHRGVYYSNVQICKFNNILVFNGTGYLFLESYDEIIAFLGPIDSKSDALFLAHLNGYYFRYNDKEFGIKKVKDAYWVYACKLVSGCLPVQTDKFLLRIDIHGNITIMEQSVLNRYDRGCI